MPKSSQSNLRLSNVRQYALITGNYWAFTVTDGALRMLVVLHFYSLGYDTLQIALMFLFYELFGVITNLLGGYLGARIGLNRTMNIGLGLQLVALSMLLVSPHLLTVAWVMVAQAISGIAKDLNKMSAKGAIKVLIPESSAKESTLFRWVALLTGSKNALKGVGFFLGGALLTWVGFHVSIMIMLLALAIVWGCSLCLLTAPLGQAKTKPKLTHLWSKSRSINNLSMARLCLFAARDVWFVVALPVYLSQQLHWQHWQVGSYLALWIIGYGLVQAFTPKLTQRLYGTNVTVRHGLFWVMSLITVPLFIAIGLSFNVAFNLSPNLQLSNTLLLMIGLAVFGLVFAVNSAIHSYLIVSMANVDTVATDLGFYYMANASGRLLGTLLSGWVFLSFGFVWCLVCSSILLVASAFFMGLLSKEHPLE